KPQLVAAPFIPQIPIRRSFCATPDGLVSVRVPPLAMAPLDPLVTPTRVTATGLRPGQDFVSRRNDRMALDRAHGDAESARVPGVLVAGLNGERLPRGRKDLHVVVQHLPEGRFLSIGGVQHDL